MIVVDQLEYLAENEVWLFINWFKVHQMETTILLKKKKKKLQIQFHKVQY